MYQISDGRLWDVDAARFVDQAPEGAEIIPLYADGKPATEDYLRRTLGRWTRSRPKSWPRSTRSATPR